MVMKLLVDWISTIGFAVNFMFVKTFWIIYSIDGTETAVMATANGKLSGYIQRAN